VLGSLTLPTRPKRAVTNWLSETLCGCVRSFCPALTCPPPDRGVATRSDGIEGNASLARRQKLKSRIRQKPRFRRGIQAFFHFRAENVRVNPSENDRRSEGLAMGPVVGESAAGGVREVMSAGKPCWSTRRMQTIFSPRAGLREMVCLLPWCRRGC
jgi:hypothetical protein